MGGNSFRPVSVIQVFMTTYDALSKIAKTATTMIPHEHTPSPRIGNAIIIYVRDSVLDKIFKHKRRYRERNLRNARIMNACPLSTNGPA